MHFAVFLEFLLEQFSSAKVQVKLLFSKPPNDDSTLLLFIEFSLLFEYVFTLQINGSIF